MLSFLGPIISLVSEPVKSYMQERTIKAENKVKVEQAKVNAQIRQIENLNAESFPLAKMLEGGTWHAGRKIAKKLREDGSPPFKLKSDGTVF